MIDKKQKKKSETKETVVVYDELPIIIIFEGKNSTAEYVLKTNNEKTKLLLNKKEY